MATGSRWSLRRRPGGSASRGGAGQALQAGPADRSQDIQAFIGSLAGQGVSKGIFITNGSFQASAREFVQRGANTTVVLLDGSALVDLMMRHQVGVRVQRARSSCWISTRTTVEDDE